MTKTIALISGLFSFFQVLAHPGIGLVKDSRGNIYYTDLQHVWRISPAGQRSVAVPDVHTHELYMDADDNLYGEHTWYNGERLNTWGSYAWCLRSTGRLDTVLGPQAGFLKDYSFCRDQKGNQYWAERFLTTRIKKKAPDGTIITLAEGKFGDIRWMLATDIGELYFIDLVSIYKIDKKSRLQVLVKELSEKHSDPAKDRHSIFGLWLDAKNNLYAAVTSERKVKKITPDGQVETVLKSPEGWAPSSGLFDGNGNLWLMEFTKENKVRVRKVEKGQPQKMTLQKGLTASLTMVATGFILLVLLSGWYFLWAAKRK